MRINLSHANNHLIEELKRSPAVAHIHHDGGDIVFAELRSGDMVAVHLVERDIDLTEIRTILNEDADLDAYTLIILWSSMLLPDEGTLYRPYDWMAALLSLYGQKIYGYDTYGQNTYIFPVHFEPEAGRTEQRIRYGSTVDMAQIGIDVIHTDARFFEGYWRIADFDDHATREQRHQARPSTNAPFSRNSMQSYYEVLGIVQGADAQTIRHAYYHLARQIHPDVNDSPDAHERMQELNAAYAHIMRQLGLEEDSTS